MQYVTPLYSKAEVDAAGDMLIDNTRVFTADYDHALEVIGNWRAAHNLPLLFIRIWLDRTSKIVDPQSLNSQRNKRLPAIRLKLDLLRWLKLSEFQDIGGCRAVVSSVQRVEKLTDLFLKSKAEHELDGQDDYVKKPKRTGYRGMHLIYRYKSERYASHNGLKIEIQLRSKLQHAWATAVETVGLFTGEALKSNRGSKDWRRFFALMGTVIAKIEKRAIVPDTPNDRIALNKKLHEYASKLNVQSNLSIYGQSLNMPTLVGKRDARYFLLILDPIAKTIVVTSFKQKRFKEANNRLLEVEKKIAEGSGFAQGTQAVLVSVDSVSNLKRAYPNWFLDMRVFSDLVNTALKGGVE